MELEIDKVSQASSLRIIAGKMLAVLCAALLLLDTRDAGSPHFKDCLAIIGKLKFPTQKNNLKKVLKDIAFINYKIYNI